MVVKLSPIEDLGLLLRYYFGDAVKSKAKSGYIHREKIGESLRFSCNGLEVHFRTMREPIANIPTPHETSYVSYGSD